jgi:hypothetical protein
LSEGSRLRALIFGINIIYESSTKVVLIMPLEVKLNWQRLEVKYLAWDFAKWTSTNIIQIIALGLKLALPGGHWFSLCTYNKKIKKSFCLKVQGIELWCLLNNVIYRSSTKVVQIFTLVSKLALPGGIDSHYVHMVKTETKTNVFWIGESYSLDFWHELCLVDLYQDCFELNPWVKILLCPREQWPTFLSFDVQQ